MAVLQNSGKFMAILETIGNSIKGLQASHVVYGATALVASRKFCVAGFYKMGGRIAELIGNEYIAEELTHAGNEYLRLAKKHIFFLVYWAF
jgi:hypothetical protein